MLYLLILLFINAAQLFSAGPITHIFLAERWMEDVKPYTEEEKLPFILGNLFPDIRYMGSIARVETHEVGVTMKAIRNTLHPFMAGMRLHAFVDDKRQELVTKSGIYQELQTIAQGHEDALLKLIEDEILWNRINGSFARDCLSTLIEEETSMGISAEEVFRWHYFISEYIRLRPSRALAIVAFSNKSLFNVPAETIKIWYERLPDLAQDKKFQLHVERLIFSFRGRFLSRGERKHD